MILDFVVSVTSAVAWPFFRQLALTNSVPRGLSEVLIGSSASLIIISAFGARFRFRRTKLQVNSNRLVFRAEFDASMQIASVTEVPSSDTSMHSSALTDSVWQAINGEPLVLEHPSCCPCLRASKLTIDLASISPYVAQFQASYFPNGSHAGEAAAATRVLRDSVRNAWRLKLYNAERVAAVLSLCQACIVAVFTCGTWFAAKSDTAVSLAVPGGVVAVCAMSLACALNLLTAKTARHFIASCLFVSNGEAHTFEIAELPGTALPEPEAPPSENQIPEQRIRATAVCTTQRLSSLPATVEAAPTSTKGADVRTVTHAQDPCKMTQNPLVLALIQTDEKTFPAAGFKPKENASDVKAPPDFVDVQDPQQARQAQPTCAQK